MKECGQHQQRTLNDQLFQRTFCFRQQFSFLDEPEAFHSVAFQKSKP
jgi:hypothetical protein